MLYLKKICDLCFSSKRIAEKELVKKKNTVCTLGGFKWET